MPIQIMLQKLGKKSLIYLAIVTVIVIIAIGLIWYFSQKEEITSPSIPTQEEIKPLSEEIIKELTTPKEGEKPVPLSEKIIKELTAPKKGEKPVPLSEEIIKELTAPQK